MSRNIEVFETIVNAEFAIKQAKAIGGMMMEHKRCPISLDQSSLSSLTPKRHKADISVLSKEKKEKVGEKVTALQQLVSPYGKTDTASVLLEAMEYIRFLQLQVEVLSAPYLCNTPRTTTQELDPYSLRSRGLCLVPISCTIGVARSNGADIWAPIKTASQKFQEQDHREDLIGRL